jgi:glutamine synthetase
MAACDKLEADSGKKPAEPFAAMAYSHNTILPDMAEARAVADKLETLTASEYWPFPVYSDLLFSV